MTAFRDSPLEASVGGTPLLDVSAISPNPAVTIHAKAEWHNPGGSVKDRPALFIVRDAIAAGDLRPGKRLLDATSGNTGIAYAWLGAAKGFGVTLAVSESVSPERRRILRAFGAELEFTDPAEQTDGAIERARELAREDPGSYYYANQYDNPSNPRSHVETTGPEVWRQTGGRVTHFLAGLGTTGTLVGTSAFLKLQDPSIQVVGLEPDSPIHGLEGLKHLETAIVPEIYDEARRDAKMVSSTDAAYAMCRTLARDHGLMVGVSSGAAAAACVELAGTLDQGHIVTVFPDSGDKYLSESFWEA